MYTKLTIWPDGSSTSITYCHSFSVEMYGPQALVSTEELMYFFHNFCHYPKCWTFLPCNGTDVKKAPCGFIFIQSHPLGTIVQEWQWVVCNVSKRLLSLQMGWLSGIFFLYSIISSCYTMIAMCVWSIELCLYCFVSMAFLVRRNLNTSQFKNWKDFLNSKR